MKLRGVAVIGLSLVMFLFASLVLSCPKAWSGLLRINLTEGRSVEVPYFWEENGEIKFEFAGGVAGILKSQVTSIQEILATKEFDPEVLLEVPKDDLNQDHDKKLQDFVAEQLPSRPTHERLDPEQGLQVLQAESMIRRGAGASNEVLHAPLFNLETDFAQLVRVKGGGVLLVIQNVLSSRTDLKNQTFTLIAYDVEGNVLQRGPCELREITVDRKTQRNLEIPGHIFSVTATVKPDPKIKRFEILAARR
jgi:hypothetical protein